jgi:protein-tyrosine phosphatase
MGHPKLLVVVFSILSLAGLIGAVAAWPGSGPAGVPNFGEVTPTLYRGAQPSAEGFHSLQQMGVTIDVNFRDGDAPAEEHEVESLGMKYVAIPWRASDDPSTAQVAQFLNLVRDNPRATIFVHCKRGADRTGTMVAAYRIALEHESTGDAVSEMHHYHYAHFWLPQLERYVDSLPQLLQTDSRFSAYAAPAPPPGGASSGEFGVPATIHTSIH